MPYYESMKTQRHRASTFGDPGLENDKLHQTDDKNEDHLVQRPQRRESERTQVWYGSIGSGEKLMRNAARRDQLRDKYNLIGLEMEATGAMNRIPVGVIRGVCDYADDHKNKEWKPFAAAMAAAYAKALLAKIGSNAAEPKAKKSNVEDKNELPSKRSRGASTDDSSTASDNGNRRKKRRRPTASRQKVVLRGQGNVNVGSGSISIGRDQSSVSKGGGGLDP